MLKLVISGGQTGADRAALDAAIACGIPHGGWCPKGRRAEDGVIPDKYLLKEHASSEYAPRTKQNVMDADGTLIILPSTVKAGFYGPGTKLTHRLAQESGKPFLLVLDTAWPQLIQRFVEQYEIQTLNVAGSRESKHPGFQLACEGLLVSAFRLILTKQKE